jgi:RND superfamily putative drug exporter
MGAAVAIGVLIDTFIVRSLLVPALTAVFGDWSWWPSGPRGLRMFRPRVQPVAPDAAASGPAAPPG